jgi:hypothetical protein
MSRKSRLLLVLILSPAVARQGFVNQCVYTNASRAAGSVRRSKNK